MAGLYDDFSGGGALYGQGVGQGLNDPRSQGILQMGLALLANSGPSLAPKSFGSTLGNAGMQGLQAAQQARQMNAQEQLRRAQLAEIQRKTRDEEEKRLMRAKFFGSVPGVAGDTPGALTDPDRLFAYGQSLLAMGEPGGASIISTAEALRKRREEEAAAAAFRSRPAVLGAGVTTDSPQGRALMANHATGDQDFDSAVLAAQNEALNSNTRLPSQPVQAPNPGLFGVLSQSPHVGTAARGLQSQLDATRHVAPQQWLSQFNNLQQQHMTASNQAIARQESGDLRRDLAGGQAELRREIEGVRSDARRDRERGTGDQRIFTREHQLSDDFARESKDFRKVKPHFQSSAKYILGGKFDSSGDRALTFAYAKSLDPQDRVGVNDLRDINKLGNVPERISQAVKALADGKQLPERVRQEMFGVIRSRFEAMNEQQIQLEDDYTERARRYMLNPDNVVGKPLSVRRKGGRGGAWSITPVQ